MCSREEKTSGPGLPPVRSRSWPEPADREQSSIRQFRLKDETAGMLRTPDRKRRGLRV